MHVPRGIPQLPAEVVCASAEGCSYLRALSTIEHIAGFEHTAQAYADAAGLCREQGCWAASTSQPKPPQPEAAEPIPFKAFYRAPRSDAAVPADGAQTLPFVRSDLVDVSSDSDGNYVERRVLKLDSLPQRGDPLGTLYEYWSDLRAAGACRFSNIDTVQLARAEIIGKLHIVDVSNSDPHNFHFELFGYAVPIARYESPCAHPVKIWAESLMRDYNTVRMSAAPRLHRLRCNLGDTSHHYTRLILPFHDKRARVTRLLVAIREEPGNAVQLKTGH
ncbi:MAG TPA: hypothetical protein VN668_05060 [Stellaceae bacterium]|nr:hypothetical protein [Stellaceae bacterium]